MDSARARDRDVLIAALRDQGLVPEDFPRGAMNDDETVLAVIGAIHRFLARTLADLMMINLDDLLAEVDTLNLPGTVDEYPNWRRRLSQTVDDLGGLTFVRDVIRAVIAERTPKRPG